MVEKDISHQVNLLQVEALDVLEVEESAWGDIAGMKPQKSIIEKKILLPLEHPELAEKHGVIHPKAILHFGPPGTGKTTFAKGIAGRLKWLFIELSPSELVSNGIESEARQLKSIFARLKGVKQAVVFIDEFEELALHPERATKTERTVSSEMLKQIPRFRQNEEVLLVCATNSIRHLNPALLRPGRFDYILPIAHLDTEAAKAVYEKYLSQLNADSLDLDILVEKSKLYTPADIETVCAQVAQIAFEKELFSGKDYKVKMEDILKATKQHKPTVTEKQLGEFEEEIRNFARCTGECIHCFTAGKSPGICLQY